MRRPLCIAIIVAFLVAICTLEQILVSSTLTELKQKSQELFLLAPDYEDISSSKIYDLTLELKDYWNKRESLICFFVNHKDMQSMGDELTRMETYCKLNNYDEFSTSLSLVVYYTEEFNHIMGLSLQNLI